MYFEDFDLDMHIDIPEVTIDRERMIEFARVYDPLPLHYDDEYARGTRFGRVIAPGVMSFMSVWARFVEMNMFGDELVAGKSTKIEWYKPVYAEDVLTGKMTVSALTERNAYNGIVETTLKVTNQHGEIVLSNVTESVVKRKTAKKT